MWFTFVEDSLSCHMISPVATDAFGLRAFGRPFVSCVQSKVGFPSQRTQLADQLFGSQSRVDFRPDFARNGDLHAAPNTTDFIGNRIHRNITLDRSRFRLRITQSRLNHTQHVVEQQCDTKTEQGCVRITQRIDLTAKGCGDILKCRFNLPV